MAKLHPDQIDLMYLDLDHLKVLSSAACSEVFQAMSFEEPLSIREISQEVNRSTASVGEHIVKLLDAGLILPVGTRKRRAREEALYAHKADSNILDPTKMDPDILTEYITKFRCDSRQSVRLMTLATQALANDKELLDYMAEKSFVGYLSREGAKKVKAAMKVAFDTFNENIEHDPQVRENGDYTRTKLTAFILPTQRESEKRLK